MRFDALAPCDDLGDVGQDPLVIGQLQLGRSSDLEIANRDLVEVLGPGGTYVPAPAPTAGVLRGIVCICLPLDHHLNPVHLAGEQREIGRLERAHIDPIQARLEYVQADLDRRGAMMDGGRQDVELAERGEGVQRQLRSGRIDPMLAGLEVHDVHDEGIQHDRVGRPPCALGVHDALLD